MEATVMVAASLWKRLQAARALWSSCSLRGRSTPRMCRPCASCPPPFGCRTYRSRTAGRTNGGSWQAMAEKEPSGSSSNDSSGASSTTPGSSSGSSSSGAPPLPPAASKSAAGGGGGAWGTFSNRHEPTEREVIFTSPAFVIFNTVDEEDVATGTVASRDSVEIVKHQLYAKASLDDLTLALKVAAQE
ncbi:hypothetical protein CLOP_g6617 [Closterium sp. NIES-67]|nr:hypothetical protein CLOP_g6617 [Closterium sp. NIES-67]